MDKAYDSKQHETKIYNEWEKSGFFNPDNLPGKRTEKFSISMPPPNATGILHLGHATMLAIQDTILRYKRMQGFKTVWIPGTDHAAIATQTKVEKIISREGKTKHGLGREKFLERVEKFVKESQDTIHNQIRKMGSSCDWSRERYTLDEGLSKAVQEIFIRMYNDGLIYRGNRIVNWCPRCESTLADDEIIFKEKQGKLYYIKYPVEDKHIVIATTRPETMLGDTAIAVNPNDKRYQNFIGKSARLPLTERKIPIVADDHVETDFGTGVLKITPAHDKDDFEIGKRHGLEVINIISSNGTLNENAGEYNGLNILDAREKVITNLKKMGLVEKIEDYTHNVSYCYRCETVIEPLVSLQWFIDVNKKIPSRGNSLKELSLQAVQSKEIKIIPKRFEKIYFHWMNNLHDWCISRQIWFGHRIPAYYCQCGQIVVSLTRPTHCWKCGSDNFTQDSDTLDTWFSSGLWTFSTLGWPDKTKDLKDFHPTSLMETGYDILFFWIARMIIMTEYALDTIPFETVYLHGMVLDKNGKKMSKSKDTGIDPVEMIDKFGADALRLSMIIGTSPGNDFQLYEEKIAGYRNFVNKLWNISRYILSTTEERSFEFSFNLKGLEYPLEDRWIASELSKTIDIVSKNLESYQLSQVGEALYDFTWNKLANWYIEIAKIRKNSNDKYLKKQKDKTLQYILHTLLKLWHPLTPFVTEAIWEEMKSPNCIMISKWPEKIKIFTKEKEGAKNFEIIQNIITTIRNTRARHKIEPGKIIDIIFRKSEKYIIENKEIIGKLTKANIIIDKNSKIDPSAITILKDKKTEIYCDLKNIIDVSKEKDRITAELESLKSYKEKLEKELKNKNFISNAPANIVERQKNQLSKTKEQIEILKNK